MNIYIGDIFCRLNEFVYPGAFKKNNCIHCNKTFAQGDITILFINNYKLFPNCMIHKNCMDSLGEPQQCVEILKSRYEQSQALRKEANELWPE